MSWRCGGPSWSAGGAQRRYGITPDLCILAKILAGGLPGGAVAGRKDVMGQLDATAAQSAKREKIGHHGTFNANPLTAAAAVVTLKLVETTDACSRAEATAEAIRSGMRKVLAEEQVPWGVYGEASAFIIFVNPQHTTIDPESFDPLALGFKGLKGARDPALINRLRLAMLANGVDLMPGPGGLVSATHRPREVGQTLEAFRRSVRWVKEEGL